MVGDVCRGLKACWRRFCWLGKVQNIGEGSFYISLHPWGMVGAVMCHCCGESSYHFREGEVGHLERLRCPVVVVWFSVKALFVVQLRSCVELRVEPAIAKCKP